MLNNVDADSDDSEAKKEKAARKKITKQFKDDIFGFVVKDKIRDANFCFR